MCDSKCDKIYFELFCFSVIVTTLVPLAALELKPSYVTGDTVSPRLSCRDTPTSCDCFRPFCGETNVFRSYVVQFRNGLSLSSFVLLNKS